MVWKYLVVVWFRSVLIVMACVMAVCMCLGEALCSYMYLYGKGVCVVQVHTIWNTCIMVVCMCTFVHVVIKGVCGMEIPCSCLEAYVIVMACVMVVCMCLRDALSLYMYLYALWYGNTLWYGYYPFRSM